MNVADEIDYVLQVRLKEIKAMDELGASIAGAKIAGKLEEEKDNSLGRADFEEDPHMEKSNIMKGVEKA